MPRRPGFPSGACRVTAASSAELCRTGCADCHTPPVRDLHSLSPHARTGSAHAAGRFLVAQHPGGKRRREERVEGTIADSSPRSDAVSPIRGVLRYGGNSAHVGDVDLSVWRTDVPLRACVFGSLAGCAMGSRALAIHRKAPWCRPPSLRIRTRFCARSDAVLHGHIAIALRKTGSIKR